MKKIYLCLSINSDTDILKARKYARYIACECGALPVAPQIYFDQFLNSKSDSERGFRIRAGMFMLSECDELWYFGDSVSRKMVSEIIAAKERNIPVKYVSDKEIEKE